MSTARRLHYSYEEYLHTLSMSDVKLEYCEGVIYAMADPRMRFSAARQSAYCTALCRKATASRRPI